MAKKNRKQAPAEERGLTRKEIRLRARNRERNRKLYIGTGAALALVVLLVLVGLLVEFVFVPNSAVAQVGDTTINTSEFRRRVLLQRTELIGQMVQMQQLEQQFGGQGFFSSQISQIEATLASPLTLGIQVLDQLINEKVALQEAEARGLTVSDEEVEEALREEVAAGQGVVTGPQATSTAEAGEVATATAAASTPTEAPTLDPSLGITATATAVPTPTPLSVMTEEQYEEGLDLLAENLNESANMSLNQYRDVIRARLLTQKLQEEIGEEVSTTETQVRARHILLRPVTPTPEPTAVPEGQPTPVPTATPAPGAPTPPPLRSREETLAEIQELRSRIVDDGEDFFDIAATYSEDTSNASLGGDLGWFGEGAMVPAFEEAAFSLPVNEISEPISTTFGYHLLQVVDRDEAREKEETTLNQERTQAYTEWLQEQVAQREIDRPDNLEAKLPPSLRDSAGQLPVQQPMGEPAVATVVTE